MRLRRYALAAAAVVACCVAAAVFSIPHRPGPTTVRPQANEHPRSVP